MTRGLHRLVLVWTLIAAIGGHWPLLQSVAWVNMLVSFSQSENFETALRKTFDGEHPCSLCRLVKKGKEAEQKQPVKTPDLKIDFFLAAAEPFEPRLTVPVETRFVPEQLRALVLRPVLPPPERA